MRRAAAIVTLVFVGAVSLTVGQTPNRVVTKACFDASDTTIYTRVSVYTDGLGRRIQSCVDTCTAYALSLGKTYDAAGREWQTTVPFGNTTSGLVADIVGAANAARQADYEAGGNHCFSEIAYKPDPLGRADALGAPGAAYSIAGTHHSRSWYLGIDANVGFVPEGDEYLNETQLDAWEQTLPSSAPGSLNGFLIVIKGPNDHEYSQEMRDVFGRTVATCGMEGIRAEYTYDILGNVLTEIPPIGSKQASDDRKTDATMACRYRYNTLNELINKSTPDAGLVKYLHDAGGKLVFSQSAKQRNRIPNATYPDLFTVYLYDELDRIVTIGTNKSEHLFDHANPLGNPGVDDVGPRQLSDINPRIRVFYDDATALCDPTVLNMDAGQLQAMALRNLRGRLAASIAYDEADQSEPAECDIWSHVVVDIYSYDDQGRVEAKYVAVPNLNAFCKHAFSYDLQGNVTQERYYREFMLASSPQWTKYYTYDKMGRLVGVKNSAQRLIAKYSYDVNGQPFTKTFHRGDGQVLDNVTQYYTVRDWPWVSQSGLGGFSEGIDYSTNGQFNGNIAAAHISRSNSSTEVLSFTYDNANRLTQVDNTGVNGSAYNEAFSYQRNGRIATKGKAGQTPAVYNYVNGTNQLRSIANFPGKSADGTYKYDENGNMALDCSKNLVIEYDWRDMPVRFRFYNFIPAQARHHEWDWSSMGLIGDNGGKVINEVRMTYDADGNRVLKLDVDKPDL